MKSHAWAAVFLFPILMQGNKHSETAACGELQDVLVPHISNAHATHRWPWHAAIYHRVDETDSMYQCGGTLISSKFIITAAHCVMIAAERVSVSLGRLYLNAGQGSAPFIKVAKILQHPDYIPENQENDIAIITLSTDAIFNSYVQPICMWEASKMDLSAVTGRFGTVVGWGVTETGEKSNALLEASLPVVPHFTCLRSNRDLFGRFLTGANFCAGNLNGTSVCSGDSGGSMTFQENGKFYIRGIVSVGAIKLDRSTNELVCDTMQYAVFTDVAQYLPWITATIASHFDHNTGQTNNDKTSQTPAADSDYSDNDDFIPFQSNRHDEFDWELTKALMLSDPSNMIFSPFFVKLLLSLLSEAAGADTSTHKELTAVLPSIQTLPQVRELYGKIFGSLLEKSSNYELKIGTKTYVDQSITPRARYTAISESYYFTKVEKLDFAKGAESAKTINDWCANITQNHVRELVKSDDIQNSVIIMLNALYFNGYWRRPFPLNETARLPFYVTPTTQLSTSFMAVTDTFYYFESQPLNAKILRLPYKGRKFSMTIVLPNAEGGLEEMIRQIRSSTLHRAQWLMSEQEVLVKIPKFEFDHTSKLNQVLQDIGIKSIFTNEASLPALARHADVAGRLQVSMILQKAGIYANERGSADYVAMEVSHVNRSGGNNTREFIANRPFIFVIEDETTGTLLFAGKVTDPAAFAL